MLYTVRSSLQAVTPKQETLHCSSCDTISTASCPHTRVTFFLQVFAMFQCMYGYQDNGMSRENDAAKSEHAVHLSSDQNAAMHVFRDCGGFCGGFALSELTRPEILRMVEEDVVADLKACVVDARAKTSKKVSTHYLQSYTMDN